MIITDPHGCVVKRVLIGAEAPDEYGQVQISYEEAVTPYKKLVAKKREEAFMRKIWKDAKGLRSWKIEKPDHIIEK